MTVASSETAGRVVYIPHGGGPLPLFGDPAHADLIAFFAELPSRLIGRPTAIVMVSAHWEAERPTLTSAAQQQLIYDYRGFAAEAYEVEYGAVGAPELASALQVLIGKAGFSADLDPNRGFDHGMFVPLKLMYPGAQIPCVQLSLVQGLDPRTHVDLGKAIASIPGEDILVVGSGLSFHNMQAMTVADPVAGERSGAFDRWLAETCSAEGLTAVDRERRLIDWEEAPFARFCHPREEHLIPLHVCFGAAGMRRARVAYQGKFAGHSISGFLW